MGYQLRDGLSFCETDGHLIFLDLRRDRYFFLEERMQHALVSALSGGTTPEADIQTLIERDILVDASRAPPRFETSFSSTLLMPTRSSIEQPFSHYSRSNAFAVAMEVTAIVARMRARLAMRHLDGVVDRLAEYRQHNASRTADVRGRCVPHVLTDAAIAFRQARPFVPIRPCCLLDSLSLVEFLARRGLFATVVFGVIGDPFSAHCWVQARDLVLNDTVGNVSAHTPIRSL